MSSADVFNKTFVTNSRQISATVLDQRRETPLHEAIRKNRQDILTYLFPKFDHDKVSLMHTIAEIGSLKLFDLLRPHLKNLQPIEKGSWTVLHSAAYHGHDKFIQIYVRFCDQNYIEMVEECNHYTAAHWAAHRQNIKALEILLPLMNPDFAKDRSGRSIYKIGNDAIKQEIFGEDSDADFCCNARHKVRKLRKLA